MKTSSAQLIGTNVSTFFDPEVTNTAAKVKADLSGGKMVASKETYTIDGQTLEIDWTKGDAKKIFDALAVDQTNTTDDGFKDIAEKLQNLFESEMKQQGVTGNIEIKAGAGGAFTIKSLNASPEGSIGYAGSDAAKADQEKTLGALFFTKDADGKSEIAEPV